MTYTQKTGLSAISVSALLGWDVVEFSNGRVTSVASVCLDFFYPRMVPGGIILFDEYNDPAWPGANRAVDKFFANLPEQPESIVRDNFEKWFVVKH